MSDTKITIEKINSIEAHPNADRLEIAKVLGYQVIVSKDSFKVGDLAIYFPPDILLPSGVADALGVTNYLKHAIFPGEGSKRPCRVGACRIRGIPSHGFLSPLASCYAEDWNYCKESWNVTEYFGAKKYEPPPRLGAGNAESEYYLFHKYTNIENIQRYPNLFDNEQVIITEKIHGTNCRMGLINGELMAGSHRVRRKSGLYWTFMDLVKPLLESFENVIIFGEIFGPGIQDMHYGRDKIDFRAFDISINGQYMNHLEMRRLCNSFNIQTVPVLYTGKFSLEIVEKYTYGNTTFSNVKGFQGREGCVIKPRDEKECEIGRLILKSISADYRNRKDAQDNE